jgi:starvation-inducible DNA-binding protein
MQNAHYDSDGKHRSTRPNMQIAIRPNIGLDDQERQAVVNILNIILADEVILTMKTRNSYWNVSGAGFYELHTLFDLQQRQLGKVSDKIAKRTRMLGGFAAGSFADFSNYARLEEQPGAVPDVLRLLADHETIIRLLREDVRKCVEEYEDQGTSDLLVRIIRLHEKMAWMLRSFVNAESPRAEENQRTINRQAQPEAG